MSNTRRGSFGDTYTLHRPRPVARRLLDTIAVSLLVLVVVGMADLCQTGQDQTLRVFR